MRSGILLLDKPAGMTSFDCIRQLKRTWKRTDLGHGGTLDKFATGLLPVLAGDGLKLVRFFLETYPGLSTYWKTYSGVIELGKSTTTADPEGELVETMPVEGLTAERVAEAMNSFVGVEYEQVPPKYSAKKIGGNRASDLMREGKDVELKAVSVTIKEFECGGIMEAHPGPSAAGGGNFLLFRVTCSKGGYVRSLAEDLARRLGTVGHLKELRREAVGSFKISQALSFEEVEARGDAALLDMTAATNFLPKFPALRAELDQLKVGVFNGLAMRLANSGLAPNVYCAALEDGQPLALLEMNADKRVNFLRAFQL